MTGWSTLSPDLQSWDEVADEADWSSLLIGNGASANLGQKRRVLHERAASLRAALVQAVKAVHVPWTQD